MRRRRCSVQLKPNETTAINGRRIDLHGPVNAIRSGAWTVVDDESNGCSDGCPVKTSRTRKPIFRLNVWLAIVLGFNGIFPGFRCPSRSIQRKALARRRGSSQTMYACFVFTTPRPHNRRPFVVVARAHDSCSLYADTGRRDAFVSRIRSKRKFRLKCRVKSASPFGHAHSNRASCSTETVIEQRLWRRGYGSANAVIRSECFCGRRTRFV